MTKRHISILILAWIAIIVLACNNVQSQQRDTTMHFGAFVNGAMPYHVASFQTIPGCPTCGSEYGTGRGLGADFGGFFEYVLSPKLMLNMRLGYHDLGATLKSTENTKVINPDHVRVDGQFIRILDAHLGAVGVAPMLSYRPEQIFGVPSPIRILIGPSINYIVSKTFEQSEQISQPSTGTFENGQRQRNQYAGTIPDASTIMFGATLGAQYELPLNRSGSMHLLPEALYTYSFSPVARGMNWHANSLAAGVSVEYTPTTIIPLPPPPPPPAPPQPPPPPPAPKMPAIAAAMDLRGVEADHATERPFKEIVIEDFIRTQYRPLLYYIFFDEGSSTLPVRYHTLMPEETKDYDFHRFYDYETLPLYYEALNIYGQRMRQFPKATLTITGCNDGVKEKGNTDLSTSRAETVYNYLKDVWGISPSRMKLDYRDLPAKPSSVNDPDGMQENRRVELSSSVEEIMEPIFTTDTAHVPKPPVLRFMPHEVAEVGVAKWQVEAQDNTDDHDAVRFDGMDTVRHTLDWDLEKETGTFRNNLRPLHGLFTLDDKRGQEAKTDPIPIPVRHYTLMDKHRDGSIDTIISRYNLILFDFNKSELGEANKRITGFVKARLTNKSKVEIFGYTDRIGSDEYNRKLSESRAMATKGSVGIGNSQVKGMGRSILLYDNTLPEGRFYCRTVSIIVTTPTKQ